MLAKVQMAKVQMAKVQMSLLWLFGAMFVVPEILFLTIPSSIINYSGKDFLTLISIFVDSRFLINNPNYFFIILVAEFIGLIGLLILGIKNKKILFSTIIIIILLWLIFISFLAYVSNRISLVL